MSNKIFTTLYDKLSTTLYDKLFAALLDYSSRSLYDKNVLPHTAPKKPDFVGSARGRFLKMLSY